jgi:hypothetical protein
MAELRGCSCLLQNTVTTSTFLTTFTFCRLRSKTVQYDSNCIVNCSLFSIGADIIYDFIYITGAAVAQSVLVSDYGLGDQGSIPDRGREFFFQPLRPDRLWGPPSLLSNGYRGPIPLGTPGRDADHSPPSSAEVESE